MFTVEFGVPSFEPVSLVSLFSSLSKRIKVSGVRHFSFDIFLFSLPA